MPMGETPTKDFLKSSEVAISATKRADIDNADDIRVSEIYRLDETRFRYRVVPDGLDASNLEVDVFAGMDRPLGGGNSLRGGLVFRLQW